MSIGINELLAQSPQVYGEKTTSGQNVGTGSSFKDMFSQLLDEEVEGAVDTMRRRPQSGLVQEERRELKELIIFLFFNNTK